MRITEIRVANVQTSEGRVTQVVVRAKEGITLHSAVGIGASFKEARNMAFVQLNRRVAKAEEWWPDDLGPDEIETLKATL